MKLNELNVGTTIELSVDDSNKPIDNLVFYKTTILGEKTGQSGEIRIQVPENGPIAKYLYEGQSVKVMIKNDGTILIWDTKVVKLDIENKEMTFILDGDIESKKATRRQSFRMTSKTELKYLNGPRENEKLFTKDLSINGLGFETNIEHQVGEKINLGLTLDGQQICVTFTVVRVTEKSEGVYFVGGTVRELLDN